MVKITEILRRMKSGIFAVQKVFKRVKFGYLGIFGLFSMFRSYNAYS